ncbi:MAG: flavoprotein [Candidatus Xenobia bacterium]
MEKPFETVIVGGGAAGFFGGLRVRALAPRASILILESAARPLGKVLISGGGRCNVTHDLNDLDRLLEFYPRGGPALASILRRFMPADTVKWFESRGVKLKTEADGRMFPVTDRSQSIVDCLLKEAARSRIEVRSGDPVRSVACSPEGYLVQSKSGRFPCRAVLLASGSSPAGYRWATALGHELVAPVPSLFTFKVNSPLLQGLAGVSLSRSRATLLLDPPITQEGPLLVTHWGLSGPAILKLSAWGARVLAERNWRCPLSVDLVPDHTGAELRELLVSLKEGGRRQLGNPPVDLPRSLWRAVLQGAELHPQRVWAETSNRDLGRLAEHLKAWRFEIAGRGVFKEEFVTAGGVPLDQVHLKTLESRASPGLFLAGEILNVDGLTGGFNFQSAWASGWVAGQGIATRLQ